jgi:integrase
MAMGALERYAADLRADGLSPATLVCYVGWPRRLAEGTGLPLTTITEADIRAWIAAHTWKPATHRRAVTALRRFFAWQAERGLRADDPAARLRAARVSADGGDPCPDDVLLNALSRASGDTYWRLRMAAETGLRRAELAAVHADDVALVDGVHRLRVAGKGGRVRRVPLSPPVAAWVAGLHGWAFPSGDGHMRPDSVGRWFARHLGANVHSLRHRFAQTAYRRGHDLEAVRLAMGHASVTTTQRYLHADADDVLAAVSGAWLDDRLRVA